MLIPLRTLPKLRLSVKKKLSLIVLFALGSFAIIASIIRTVLFLSDATLAKVVLWSFIEEVVCFLVANGPILRPLFFRGNNFESSGATNRQGLHDTSGRMFTDLYEMSPKDIGVVSVVSAGETRPARARQELMRMRSHNENLKTVDILRTVEVTVESKERGSNVPV